MKIDLAGQRFGNWTVLAPLPARPVPSGQQRTMWLCRCVCGAERAVGAANLRHGNPRRCSRCKSTILPNGETLIEAAARIGVAASTVRARLDRGSDLERALVPESLAPRPSTATCSVPGCPRRVQARGMCHGHYRRVWAGLDAGPAFKEGVRHLPLEERLRVSINRDGPIMPGMDTPCWEWVGCHNEHGYSTINIRGADGKHHSTLVHRFLFERKHGVLPRHIQACHKCNNRGCVRENHVYGGTAKQNMEDRKRAGNDPCGERCGAAVLSDEDAAQLRLIVAISGLPATTVGRAFGVSGSTALGIVRGRTYRHIGPPTFVRGTR